MLIIDPPSGVEQALLTKWTGIHEIPEASTIMQTMSWAWNNRFEGFPDHVCQQLEEQSRYGNDLRSELLKAGLA